MMCEKNLKLYRVPPRDKPRLELDPLIELFEIVFSLRVLLIFEILLFSRFSRKI